MATFKARIHLPPTLRNPGTGAEESASDASIDDVTAWLRKEANLLGDAGTADESLVGDTLVSGTRIDGREVRIAWEGLGVDAERVRELYRQLGIIVMEEGQ